MEKEYMRQMVERPPSGKILRESGEDYNSQKGNMQTFFDDPIRERIRRSRDTFSQKMLSFGAEYVSAIRVIFDWLNREELDVKELQPSDSNEYTNMHSIISEDYENTKPAENILQFFSGGFLREDQAGSNEQTGFEGAKIHSLQRDFLQPKVPVFHYYSLK